MEKVTFEVWSPEIAPYNWVIENLLCGYSILVLLAIIIIGFGLYMLYWAWDNGCLILPAVLAILVVFGVPGTCALTVGMSNISVCGYVQRYGEYELEYLESVQPALERIQKAKVDDSVDWRDKEIVVKYVSELSKTKEYRRDQAPSTLCKKLADGKLKSATGENLVDLVNWDRLFRTVSIERVEQAIQK